MNVFIDDSSGVSGLALDPYTAGVWGVYALARYLTAYTGPLVRVRRSSDNAEQDIGYDGLNALDTTALASFVGANSAFVVKWYDQSGGGNDLAQATSANQPLLVNAGSYLGVARFDGSNDYLISPNSGTPTAFTVFTRITNNNAAATVKVWLEQNSAAPGDAAILFYAATNRTEANFSQSSNTIARAAQFNVVATGQVQAARYTRQQALIANSIALYETGSALSPTFTSNAGTSTGSFVAAPWSLGARLGSLAAQIDVANLVIYEAAKSNGDMTAISGVV